MATRLYCLTTLHQLRRPIQRVGRVPNRELYVLSAVEDFLHTTVLVVIQ